MENILNKFRLSSEEGTDLIKQLPRNLKVTTLRTFIIGLAVHMFVYTNPIFGHDAAQMYWDPVSFTTAASNSRWLIVFWQSLTKNVFQPWMCGLLTLIMYSLSAWVVCETLEIKRTKAVVAVSGILITAPAVISSNLYLSSAYIYAAAMLLSCLSPYFYKKYRFGWIPAILCMFMCGGTYAGYVSVGLTIFLIDSVVQIITGKDKDFMKVFVKHLGYLVVFVVAMVANALVLVVFGGQTSMRGLSLTSTSDAGYLKRIIDAWLYSVDYYMPDSVSTGYSFLQRQRPYYWLFFAAAVATVLRGIYLIYKNKRIKSPLTLCIAMFDVLCLPLAINIIGALAYSYTLTQPAFVLPWVVFILIYETLCSSTEITAEINSNTKKAIAGAMYTVLIAAISLTAVWNNSLLANVAYTKAYNNYEAGLALANRIIAKAENTDGYITGETQVLFVGSPRDVSASDHSGHYDFCGSLAGVGYSHWDTAFTFMAPLKCFINQQLANGMTIINGDFFITAEEAEAQLKGIAPEIFDNIGETIAEMKSFPENDCYILQDGILIFKLGEKNY